MGNNYLHPNVESQIMDNSEVVTFADSDITLFACLTADQGPDNQVVTVGTQSEFINKFGNPNYEKHGQTAYNVMNWLGVGGNARIIRVTPSDAGFANLFLSLQTKYTYEADGVTLAKANIRPTFYYTNNNASISALETELSMSGTTIDGYRDNVLLGFYPNGRGEIYNNLAVSLTLNDSYMDTYAFRLYDLVFYNVSEDGDVTTLESYLVSLSPTTSNTAGESMFIKTVVEKASSVFSVLFNRELFDTMGEEINKYVNVGTLDLLTGKQDTLFDEDVTYTPTGSSTSYKTHHKIEIAELNDTNKSYIGLDNAKRTNEVTMYNGKFTVASDAVRLIGRGSYLAYIDQKIGEFDDRTLPLSNSLTTLLADIKTVNEDAALDRTITGSLKDLIEKSIKTTSSYVGLTASAANAKTLAEAYLKSAKDVVYGLNSITRIEIGTALRKLGAQYENLINLGLKREAKVVLMNLVSTIITTISEAEAITLATEVATTFDDLDKAVENLPALNATITLQYTEAGSVVNVENHTAYVTLIQSNYNTVKTNFNTVINDRFATTDEKAVAVEDAVNALKGILVLCKEYLAVIELFINADYVLDIATISGELISAIGTAAVTQTESILTPEKRVYIASVAGKAELTAEDGRAVTFVDEAEAEYVSASGKDYLLALGDFSEVTSFKRGTDGSIVYTPSNLANRRTTIAALLVAGYSGLIDSSVTDPKMVKFSDMMDASYASGVKQAMVNLASKTRKDCFVFLDCGISNLTPEETIKYKASNASFNTCYAALYGASLAVDDTAYTKNIIEVTPTYFLADKVPYLQDTYGIHYPIAGARRGTLDNVKSLSFNPNPTQKENMYRVQINYIEKDPKSIKIATQNTTQKKNSALSKVNNVRLLNKIKTEVEELMENYLQEFNDNNVVSAANTALTNYLTPFLTNGMVTSLTGTVYSSEADAKNGILRVKIEIEFKNIIERVKINLFVK